MGTLYGYVRVNAYIFGAKVSANLQRVRFIRDDDSKGPGRVEIVLASPNHRYITTDEDIGRFAIQDGDATEEEIAAVLDGDPARIEAETEGALDVIDALDLGNVTDADIALYRQNAARTARSYFEAKSVARRRLQILQKARGRLDSKIRERLAAEVDDPLKRSILLSKFGVLQPVQQPPVVSAGSVAERLAQANREVYAELEGLVPRYPFWAREPIFHPNDPVVVFVRDFFDPTTWHWGFVGEVSDCSVSTGVDGEERVTIMAEDPLRKFAFSRVATNPSVLDIDKVAEAEDFVFRTFSAENFSNLTLEEYIFSVAYGPGEIGAAGRIEGLSARDRAALGARETLDITRRNADGVVHTQQVPRYGVGGFDLERSRVFAFGPAPASPTGTPGQPRLPIFKELERQLDGDAALEAYQSTVDTVLRWQDVFDRRLPNTGSPTPETIEDVMDEIGQNPQYYPVDGGRIILLAPASLGPDTNSDVLTRELVGAIPNSTSFRSRLEMLYQVLDRLEFRLFCTPKGDVCVEMPLCDFAPHNFGAYAERYTLQPIETISDNTTRNDARVKTQARAHWNLVPNWANAPSKDAGFVVVETLRGLVPMYGLRLHDVDPPVWLGSEIAARLYAQIQLNKINAEAVTTQLDHVPNPGWTPNRPVEWVKGSRILTTRNVSFTIDWSGKGSVSGSSGLNYTRLWSGKLDADGRRLYSTLGGAPGKPYDYAILFSRRNAQGAG